MSYHQPDGVTKTQINKLLRDKFGRIKQNVRPKVTANDILNLTPAATSLPNVPNDLQLQWFFTNSATIESHFGRAKKDSAAQPRNITRGIFYYNTDKQHNFCRYFRETRFALLTYLTRLYEGEADEFETMYIRAWREGLLNISFEHRETFIRMWKDEKRGLLKASSAQYGAAAKITRAICDKYHKEKAGLKSEFKEGTKEAEKRNAAINAIEELLAIRSDEVSLEGVEPGVQAGAGNTSVWTGDDDEKEVEGEGNYLVEALLSPGNASDDADDFFVTSLETDLATMALDYLTEKGGVRALVEAMEKVEL